MPVLTQTTEITDYLQYLTATVGGNRLQSLVAGYLSDRANVLGLPQPTPQKQLPAGVQPQQNPNNPNNLAVQVAPNTNLRARIAAGGVAFSEIIAQADIIKTTIEGLVNEFVLVDLGGVAGISQTSKEWSWLLTKDASANLAFFPDNGTVFKLPGIVFRVFTSATFAAAPTQWFGVTISIDPDSKVPSVTYTQGGQLVNGAIVGGVAWNGPDPM